MTRINDKRKIGAPSVSSFHSGDILMTTINGKRKVGETLSSSDDIKTPLVNNPSTYHTLPESTYFPRHLLKHTMASSSKGKQTLEDHYASLSLQNDDEEEVDLPFGDVNTEDPEIESFMLVGTLITEKSVKFNYLKKTLYSVETYEGDGGKGDLNQSLYFLFLP